MYLEGWLALVVVAAGSGWGCHPRYQPSASDTRIRREAVHNALDTTKRAFDGTAPRLRGDQPRRRERRAQANKFATLGMVAFSDGGRHKL
jgi:hypothetical protein